MQARKTEILAPAGSREALTAAVRSGADAVYLGVGSFNARRNAKNFTPEELPSLISDCHLRGAKVHLALNTLVSDAELPGVIHTIECACTGGADAFIVQDLGTARLLKQMAPDAVLHASTQMAVMHPAGIRLLEDLGFSRVVLPRELSLSEIRDIRASTDLELELFVHGALCMCVSGQCYLSAMLGERSGNRGLCAQPCRLPFSAEQGTGHDLSLKDLSLISYLPLLAEAGICSFKIEGRMKRPEYVAAAVTACKNALEGKEDPLLTQNLEKVFSRSGFTDGYYKDRRGPSMFGIRRKEDVVAADSVLKSLSALYEEEVAGTTVDFVFSAEAGVYPALTASAKGQTVTVTGEAPVQRAQKKAATADSVSAQLKKVGGTGFAPGNMEIRLGEGTFLPVSTVNALRRDALQKLTESLKAAAAVPFRKDCITLPEQLPDGQHGGMRTKYLRFETEAQISEPLLLEAPGTYTFLVPLRAGSSLYRKLREKGIPFGVELPRALYGNVSPLESALEEAKQEGAAFAYCGNLDSVSLAREHGLPVLGGFSLNIFNSLSADVLSRLLQGQNLLGITVSAELTLKEAEALKIAVPKGIFAYGRLPLMLTRNSPSGKETPELTDRKGYTFPVRKNGSAYELLNSAPTYLGDKPADQKKFDFGIWWFTTETAKDVLTVLEQYQNGTAAEGAYTRGLYYRGVK